MVIRRDPERLNKLRLAIRYLLREDALARGHQSRLAEHFSVSRQRVHQVVNEEQVRREQAARTRGIVSSRSSASTNGAIPAPAMNNPPLEP
jgi:hypothetical protein